MTEPQNLAEALQRSLREAKAARKPSKPWRVYARGGISTDYRGQRAAYEAVKSIVATGTRATVWHWEGGRWVKYEVIEPEGN